MNACEFEELFTVCEYAQSLFISKEVSITGEVCEIQSLWKISHCICLHYCIQLQLPNILIIVFMEENFFLKNRSLE